MKTNHIIVEVGAEKGQELHIPPEGARLGRAPKNDIVLEDALLSRYHCRFFFNPAGSLTVTDLGSSNQTMVNGKEIMEQTLQPGDVVQVGDTILKVLNNGTGAGATPQGAGTPKGFDLGLHTRPDRTGKPRPKNPNALGKKKLLTLAGAILLVAALIASIKLMTAPTATVEAQPTITQPEPQVLSINYEKVEADASNIFRYHLTITPELDISIEIDDLINNRTVRKEKKLNEELIQNLIRHIENSSFFDLRSEYVGMQPDIFHQWELSITINKKTHTVKVLNRTEPDAFKDIREEIEVFGKNELGLWAIQFSTERLLDMAENEYLTGKSLFAERAVNYGNLFEALQNFQKAVIDLETVEPKPTFHADALAMITECQQRLQAQYDDLSFQAERAMRLQEWENAAEKLRIILELIPDRSDDRNQQARKQLLDVEERIKANE